ncbi:type II toxin-antitoxin system VapC family toxin [Pyrobaculum ferrireducens]|uniref:PIN domain-containing protein n=1 Tax=Pyrobaculum ferrireducens TaxID=1104324 RepID=G7VFA7_9CREN|nr:type II toxin-antitoxin system VapC family toxin [Pyrobaculum ferrireducens]AET31723.1 hypothetical protein P186_0263 [Pyrobaculum ferrireducens]
MRLVVDASVVVKWALPEPHHQEARKLRDDHLAGRVRASAPPCLWLEVASALRKYALRGIISRDKAVEALKLLHQTDIEIIDVEPARVLETALRLGVTVYDAAYISLAESLGVDFYTADEKLLNHTNAKHITQYKRPRGQ